MSGLGGNRKGESLHYHIRWSGNAGLDWECFRTRAAAEESAKQLVRPYETYSIEEYDEACPQWRAALRLKSPPLPTRSGDGDGFKNSPLQKYPDWQQPVFEALAETELNELHTKIGRAEIAIKQRLLELSRSEGHHEELQLLKNALGSLQVLMSETKRKKKNG